MSLTSLIKRRYQLWLDRRIPTMKSVTLNQRRIFIFPSRAGRWFLLVLLVMLLSAINYQNSMSFALVFLLASVFIITILHTFANLSGLTITALRANPVFSGDSAELELAVSRFGDKEYFDVNFSWPGSEVVTVSLTDCVEQLVILHIPVAQRGLYRPGRLLIETFYPLGLLRCRTWLSLELEVVVFPCPLACLLEGVASSDNNTDGELIYETGSDDFYAFKPYSAGDPIKHVYWKSYAKGQALQTKKFSSYSQQSIYLDWQMVAGTTEERLSKLCYWVLAIENNNDEYGLRLPGIDIAPSQGEEHQLTVLTALATYNLAVKN